MLIVLEGCDGSGKSTLACSLSRLLDAEIIHCSSTTPNTKEFFEEIIEASRTRNIIADRFCYGQFVYQPIGERPLGNIGDLNMLEVKMLDAGAKVVWVHASDETIEQRLKYRNETVINGLDIRDVQSKFRELFEEYSLFCNTYNFWNTDF